MGWTMNSDWKTVMDAINAEFRGCEIVEKSVKKNGDAYLAVRHPKHQYIYAVVALVRKDEGEYGIKTYDETMIPHYFDCPKRVLKWLSPAETMVKVVGESGVENAKEWRKRVHEYHALPKSPKLREGMCVRFKEPVDFDSFEETDFKVTKLSGRFLFLPRNNTGLCRIRTYKRMEFEVLGEDQSW